MNDFPICMAASSPVVIGQPGAMKGNAGAKSAADWKGLGVSEGAPLPPADRFKPQSHPDVVKAGLFDRLDADKNGFVTEEEFKTLWRSRQ